MRFKKNLEKVVVILDHALLRKQVESFVAGALPQGGQQLGFVREATHALSQRRSVSRRKAEARVADEFRCAAVVRDDHGAPAHHLLHDHQAGWFFPARLQHQYVYILGCVVQLRPAQGAGKDRARFESRARGEILKALPLRSISNDRKSNFVPRTLTCRTASIRVGTSFSCTSRPTYPTSGWKGLPEALASAARFRRPPPRARHSGSRWSAAVVHVLRRGG